MPLIQTEAIILGSRKFSESSKIISVFTKDRGRISILVKGGRKGTKKFPGGLETLNRVEAQIYQKSGRELQNFKAADLVDAYPNLRKDLSLTYTALSLAETVERTTLPDDAHPDLFDTLAESFWALNRTGLHPWTIRWRGLLGICRALGFGLTLEGCALCGKKRPMRAFSLVRGGFVCASCFKPDADTLALPGEIWGVLRFLNSCPIQAAVRLKVLPLIGRRIETLFLMYFKYHIPGLKGFSTWKALPQTYWGSKTDNSRENQDG
ncbi:MAG TPA: DNA repair protein RecO [bacterium]